MTPGSQAWLDQVVETPLEPARPIIDPHHHFWRHHGWTPYLLEELWSDTDSGHRIEKTVFIECSAEYRPEGPKEMRSLGETEFAATLAQRSQCEPNRAQVAGLVVRADLRLGDRLEAVLDAHESSAAGLLRGVRHPGARDDHGELLHIAGRSEKDLYANPDFRNGMRVLAARGLAYDTWHYHHQNPAFAALARAVPEATMILDHFGTPLGVGQYAGRRSEILESWKKDIAEIARCPNVYAKLGGLAMPDNGFGWDQRATPATSDELVEAQRAYYLHTIECFGPQRCMFESNFPVDRLSIAYPVLWNAFKKMVADFSEDEKTAMFHDTAARVYRL